MKGKRSHIGIQLPKGERYLHIARLAASGIASRMNFPLDEIEDIKTALTEACNNTSGYPEKNDNLEINFEIDQNKLEITVEDKGQALETPDFERKNALGISFMKSLMDELEYACSKDFGTKIKMVKYNESVLKNIAKKQS